MRTPAAPRVQRTRSRGSSSWGSAGRRALWRSRSAETPALQTRAPRLGRRRPVFQVEDLVVPSHEGPEREELVAEPAAWCGEVPAKPGGATSRVALPGWNRPRRDIDAARTDVGCEA